MKNRIEDYKKKAEEFTEPELFFHIEAIDAEGRMKLPPGTFGNDQEFFQALQDINKSMLPNFKVNPESVNDPEGSYQRWFTFWKRWKKMFSESQWWRITERMDEKKSIDEFLPKRKWYE